MFRVGMKGQGAGRMGGVVEWVGWENEWGWLRMLQGGREGGERNR